ncbi:hypothetical protein QJQ45_021935 [Haematococcus lacustris]|nr:hypothetical protein QJQ45_021935 [Haematococcus lacustris]
MDCNAALNMQRIGESKWRPLELCYWPDQGALPAKGKEYPDHGYKRLEREMAQLSMKRHKRAMQLVVFFGAATIGTAGGGPPQAPRSSQAATQPAASEPGPSTPPPAKRSKPAAEPTKGKGKAARAKPAPQPGRWLDMDCNAALNMQRIGESKWRPLELCYWPDQGALPAKGKEYPEHGYKRRDNGLVWSRAEVAARASAWHCVTCFTVPLCVAAYARPRNCPVARGFQFAVSQELSKERETRFWKAELDKALNEKNYFVQRCAQAERERSIAIAELRRHQTLEAQRAQAALLIPAGSGHHLSKSSDTSRHSTDVQPARYSVEQQQGTPTKSQVPASHASDPHEVQADAQQARGLAPASVMGPVPKAVQRASEVCQELRLLLKQLVTVVATVTATEGSHAALHSTRVNKVMAAAHSSAATLQQLVMEQAADVLFHTSRAEAHESEANLVRRVLCIGWVSASLLTLHATAHCLQLREEIERVACVNDQTSTEASTLASELHSCHARLNRLSTELALKDHMVELLSSQLAELVSGNAFSSTPSHYCRSRGTSLSLAGGVSERHSEEIPSPWLFKQGHCEALGWGSLGRMSLDQLAMAQAVPPSLWLQQLPEEGQLEVWGSRPASGEVGAESQTYSPSPCTVLMASPPTATPASECAPKLQTQQRTSIGQRLLPPPPTSTAPNLASDVADEDAEGLQEDRIGIQMHSFLSSQAAVLPSTPHGMDVKTAVPDVTMLAEATMGWSSGQSDLTQPTGSALLQQQGQEQDEEQQQEVQKPDERQQQQQGGQSDLGVELKKDIEAGHARSGKVRRHSLSDIVAKFNATPAKALGPPQLGEAGLARIGGTNGRGDQMRRWKLTKGEVKHASGLNNARRDTERWLAPIKPHLQHLAAASSAGTSLEANLKHITVTLATWDAVWEVYLDPKWARQRLRLYGAQDRALEQFFNKVRVGSWRERWRSLSMKRHKRAMQLVVFFGAATIGTAGGWGADAVLRACRKVVCRPRGPDQLRGRVVLVDEHRTSRVSSAVNGKQPCEVELDKLSATRPAGWKPPAGQVEPCLLRPAWSQQRDQPVRGLMWCPVVAPRKPPQAPRSSQAATQPAASEPGPNTPPPAKRSKPAAEPTKGKGKGKAARAKPAPQPGRWLDRDCNAALNMQRIGESKLPCPLCRAAVVRCWNLAMLTSASGGNVSSAEVYREAVAIISQRTVDGKHLTAEYRSVIHNDQLIGHSVQDSQRSENAARNRYINVLPYDFNRVLLRDGQQQYVNASYVRQADRNLGGELNYLATQGPLPSTVADFWRMVYEQQVPTVIMLTNVTERGIVKCHPYYPDKPGDNLTPGKDIQVACLSSAQHHDGQITDRSLQVRVGTGPPVMVRQLCFHAWPDHGAPNDSTAIRTVSKLLHREGSVHQSTSPLPQPAAAAAAQQGAGSVSQLPATATVSLGAGQQDGSSSAGSPLAAPLAVVHCSAGIGRTGTFIAVDIVRQRLHHLAAQAGSGTMARHVAMRLLAEALDVPTLVHELRQQRMGMVQTFEQYAFIYQALLEELQASLDSSPDADVQPAKDAIDTAGAGAGAAAAAPSKAVKRGW